MSFLLSWIFLATNAVSAANYFLGYSSVDGWEIRWWGGTIYGSQLSSGINTWNGLGKINIAPDTIYTLEDLTVSDYNDPQSSVWARYGYVWAYSTDLLQFNSYQMNLMTNSQKINSATHELGHALWLNHSITNNVMYYMVTWRTTLGTQDTYDYRTLYGY